MTIRSRIKTSSDATVMAVAAPVRTLIQIPDEFFLPTMTSFEPVVTRFI